MENPDQDERLLIEQAKVDKQAFGKLYELHVDRIYNYIYYRTGNIGDAEDLTARVFFRAIRHIGNYEDRGVPFSAWLYYWWGSLSSITVFIGRWIRFRRERGSGRIL